MLLRGYADERDAGVVLGSRYPMRLDAQWSPEPDVMVVRHEHSHRLRSTHLEGAADFVIEITSESDPKLDYREKLPRYRAAGIEEIWIVDRFAMHLHVDTKLADGYQTRVIRRGKVKSTALPGFWIDISWLWRRNLPSSFKCLRDILK
jgi:Uma2 family endonuclease